jgi:hypothetical protein
MIEATQKADMAEVTQRTERMYRLWFYPACMASLVNSDGAIHNEMTYEEWIALPNELLEEWFAASIELNPSFSPFFERRRRGTPEAG